MRTNLGPYRRIAIATADQLAICFVFDGVKYQDTCKELQADGSYKINEKCMHQFPHNFPLLGSDQSSPYNYNDTSAIVKYKPDFDEDFPDLFNAIKYYWWEVLLLCIFSALIFQLCLLIIKRRNQSNNRLGNKFSSPTVSDSGTISIGKISFNPNKVLGYGSKGTCVFKGSFENSTKCAVKRIVSEYLKFADREIEFLRSLQDPHLVRYLATEEDVQFVYIALELAEYTLADLVDKDIISSIALSRVELCRQAALGLQHLHKLDIVHRDLKPQNILVSFPFKPDCERKVMLSDFGLSKYLKTVNNDPTSSAFRYYDGTTGWIAPEIVKAKLNEEKTILPTKAADIFSLGCVFYYIISGGQHPFGKSANRQYNILSGLDSMNLFSLSRCLDENELNEEQVVMATHVIESMISNNPINRPTIGHILRHPMFWNRANQLQFLLDVSDRIEKATYSSSIVRSIESNRLKIIGYDWIAALGEELRAELCKFRSYREHKIGDLLRAIRNKRHHYHDCSEAVRKSLGEVPNGFLAYFTSRFPRLIPHVYAAMQAYKDEGLFKDYYEHDEDEVDEIYTSNASDEKEEGEKVKFVDKDDLSSSDVLCNGKEANDNDDCSELLDNTKHDSSVLRYTNSECMAIKKDIGDIQTNSAENLLLKRNATKKRNFNKDSLFFSSKTRNQIDEQKPALKGYNWPALIAIGVKGNQQHQHQH